MSEELRRLIEASIQAWLREAVADERAACAKWLEEIGGRDDLAAIIRVGGHL